MRLRGAFSDFRFRIASAATGIAVLVGVLLTSVTVVRSTREARQALQSSGQRRAERLAYDVVVGVLAADRDEVERTARSFLALPDAAAVAVYRDRERFVAIGSGPPAKDEVAPTLAPGEIRTREARDALVFQAPVVLERSPTGGAMQEDWGRLDVIGVAEVVLSLSRVRAQRNATIVVNGVLLSFAIALAILVSALSARRLARPVQQLIRAAEQVGAGRMNVRVPVVADDAIGRLSETFNRMVDDLRALNEARQRSEEELRRHADALRDADRRKDEFLSAASHELRTPLTTLRLQTQTIARMLRPAHADEQRVTRKLSSIDEQLDRLEGLVNTLFDVSRIVGGRLEVQREPVDLGEIAANAVEQFDDLAERTGSELVLSAARVVGRWDHLRLDQVLTNLVGNALKFAPGKPVEITVSERSGQAVLVVRDHGPGISPESQARIFERFERAAESRTFGGLGLGLWITRQIVEAHGGTITVESAPGRGASFTVVLPRSAP